MSDHNPPPVAPLRSSTAATWAMSRNGWRVWNRNGLAQRWPVKSMISARERGLTQAQLAAKAGVPDAVIKRLEEADY